MASSPVNAAPSSSILVTGAAGFIGARTCELLLQQGVQVVGVDNFNDYYDVRLKRHRVERVAITAQASPAGADRFGFHELDIENRTAVDDLFKSHRFDGVINLAARAGVRYSLDNPLVYLRTNTEGTLNLLEAMRAHAVKKLVLASTSSLYAGAPLPFSEQADVTRPISTYAATKLAAEALAHAYHHLFNLDVSVVRYFTVYGPAARPDMSPFRFVKWIDEGQPVQLFGDGSQTRDFTFVDDIAAGTVAALRPLGFEVINLGGGNRPISLRAMIGLIEGYLGKTAIIDQHPAHAADMQDTQADITKARDLLGWSPRVTPEEGFRETVDWYVRNREWVRELAT